MWCSGHGTAGGHGQKSGPICTEAQPQVAIALPQNMTKSHLFLIASLLLLVRHLLLLAWHLFLVASGQNVGIFLILSMLDKTCRL